MTPAAAAYQARQQIFVDLCATTRAQRENGWTLKDIKTDALDNEHDPELVDWALRELRVSDRRAKTSPDNSRKGGRPPAPPHTDAAATTAPRVDGVSVESVRAALWAIAQEKIGATEAYRKSAAAVVEWLHARGRFYHDAARRDFAGVLYFDTERKLLLPVQSDAFVAWQSDCMAVNRSERVFQFVASACETEGLSERATAIEPANYWAARPGAVYLSNGPGRMAKMTAAGVELVDNGTDGVLFPVGACLEPWAHVEPVDPFETCALFRDIAAAAPHGPLLFKLWAIALPADGKTKPPACVTAPVGGGKTALVRGLFALLGMPETVNAVSKNGEGDFWAAVDAGGLVCFDNVDTRVDWLPDALAAAATAGTFTKRRLYTDSARVTLRARSPIVITSASPSFASDAGLADRLIVVRLNRRTGETAESALFDEVRANRDAGLSWIAATLAKALADVAPVPSGLNARHPDFARLAVKIGRAIGREAEAVAAMRAAEADKGLFNLENDTIGAALLELVAAGPFTGTAAELLEALKKIDPGFDGRLSLKSLGKRLSKLWPHIESTLAAAKDRDGHTRTWRYFFKPPAGFAGFGEPFSEKSYARENIGTFTESPLETPQTTQPAFDFTNETEPEDDETEERKAIQADWKTGHHDGHDGYDGNSKTFSSDSLVKKSFRNGDMTDMTDMDPTPEPSELDFSTPDFEEGTI